MVVHWASKELREDKEVVLAAVKNNGSAIEFASHALQKDKDVLLASVKNNMPFISIVSCNMTRIFLPRLFLLDIPYNLPLQY